MKNTKMKLSDYVADFLAQAGVTHTFGLTGGAVVHLLDSLAQHTTITPVFVHHEQAAALAAQAYARYKNDVGACFVTTGPGGTNTLTGVLAAWMDSIPCIFVSGQARFDHTPQGKPIRQLGVQEFNIAGMVTPITKYAVLVDDPQKIRYYLEKALYCARHGRPGPVWIDIPLDFQWAQIEPHKLLSFNPKEIKSTQLTRSVLENKIQKFITLLRASAKPLILAGAGIRLAHAEKEFNEFISTLKIPFVASWNASDLLPTANPHYIGRIGMTGQRGANTAIQNCDLLIGVGSHFCHALTRIRDEVFAPHAKKIIIDIDPDEIAHGYVKTDLAIQTDAKLFLQELLQLLKRKKITGFGEKSWKQTTAEYKSLNDIPADFQKQTQYVNPYVFIDVLTRKLDKDTTIVVDGGGTALFMPFQAAQIRAGQRMLVSAGISAMGTGLPESIGACFASHKKPVICMIGDGSFQLNVQELQTIAHHKLPIKILVFNNDGYLAIRHTQAMYLDKRYFGTNTQGGLSIPDIGQVSRAYGIKTIRLNSHKQMPRVITTLLKEKGPLVCEIMVSPEHQMLPVL